MAGHDAPVSPTSGGLSHFNTVVVPRVRLCFSLCPGNRSKGIDGVEYTVWDDDPRTLGAKQVYAGTSKSGIVEIPWVPAKRGAKRTDEAMFLQMFDTQYEINLRDTIGRVETRPESLLTGKDMAVCTGTRATATPNENLKAYQERLDLLGYLIGFLDNEDAESGILDPSDRGINDAITEQAVLNFQRDTRMLPVTGAFDAGTVLSLRDRSESDGYPNGN